MITKEIPTQIQATTKKNAPPLPISGWLNELEAKRAKEFHRRTGLDYQTLLRQIIEIAEPFPGIQILEVAAGTGMIARHLVGLIGTEGKIIGVDGTKDLVEKARLDAQSAKVGTKIEWKIAPYNHLPFNDNRFDLIACGLSFNQLDAQEFFRESTRVLKNEGTLLFAAELTPQDGLGDFAHKLRRHYQRLIKRDTDESKMQYYSSDELTEMLRAAGFRQILIRGLKGQTGIGGRRFSLIRAVK